MYLAQNEVLGDMTGSFNYKCTRAIKKRDLKQSSSWPSWGYDNFNSRNQPNSNINADNVKSLKLRWSFGISSQDVRAQPIVIGEVILLSESDSLHALNRKNGCTYWKFTSKARLRNAPVLNEIDGESIFLVDSDFEVYKLNLLSGELIWKSKIPVDYESNIPSASPVQSGKYLIVPISTFETVLAIDPRHECCKTSGGIAAVDTVSGEIIWTHRIEEKSKSLGKGLITRIEKFAPAGSAVWNAPGIDREDKRIFFGTGQSLQSPASNYSDAIISMNLESGEKIWATQTLKGDAYNMGCEIRGIKRLVCPEEKGPDFDFGASVIQSKNQEGEKILLAGQKSGWVFRLDINTGEISWKSKVGNGGTLGGVHFGMTTDNKNLFAAIADTNFINKFPGKPTPGIYSLDGLTGKLNWKFTPQDRCAENEKPACDVGISAALTATNDLIVGGGFDGWLYVLNKDNGKLLWEYNTNVDFSELAGIQAHGGSIESDGPVISGNNLLINSGYLYGGRLGGNVLLNF